VSNRHQRPPDAVVPDAGTTDRWVRWHDAYDDPTSAQTRRLRLVQAQIQLVLDQAPAGPIRVLSLCAGQGRDLLEVLRDHPRRADVSARLVELDPRLAAQARALAAEVGECRIEVVEGDAGTTDACVGAVPADLLLLAGIFGNVPDADIERMAQATSMLCAAGATVIWTRHRRPPDVTSTIRGWYRAADVQELAFIAPDDELFSVWVGRFTGPPEPVQHGGRLFTFVKP
jgi:Putative methyltransferase